MYSNLNLNDKLYVFLPEATHALSCFFSKSLSLLSFYVSHMPITATTKKWSSIHISEERNHG